MHVGVIIGSIVHVTFNTHVIILDQEVHMLGTLYLTCMKLTLSRQKIQMFPTPNY